MHYAVRWLKGNNPFLLLAPWDASLSLQHVCNSSRERWAWVISVWGSLPWDPALTPVIAGRTGTVSHGNALAKILLLKVVRVRREDMRMCSQGCNGGELAVLQGDGLCMGAQGKAGRCETTGGNDCISTREIWPGIGSWWHTKPYFSRCNWTGCEKKEKSEDSSRSAPWHCEIQLIN